jgi:CubicO group peptidase (beta-lactamase class C family)
MLTGYRVTDWAWEEELPPLPDGDWAPMAGLWSTVNDLAKWIAFFLDAFPARDDPDPGPLRRSSRREMQHVHRAWRSTYNAGTGRLEAGGYGFGLTVIHDLRFGHIVAHAGGLPGFGSHMRWLPDRGVGVVALANRTYAPMTLATIETLELLDNRGALPLPAPTPTSHALITASAGLGILLNAWDDERANALFADNVFLDENRETRRQQASMLRAACGELRVSSIEAESSTRATVTYVGDLGCVQVKIMLSPQREARIQQYSVASTRWTAT